ncbi:site-specific integrase [Brevundimonas diminuta]|uniref:site-specific integrase n=1 Tax=Brevundimonas diminuta TaxID=293 RepID=UPI00209854C0|nr:site-specific integrase [Brevundimonas diminuta]MCO8030096.1 site-specific integrase [Brevundimonas diminuta]
MSRKPAPPTGLRNGLKWRDGRPRWEPSPANRACGFAGVDLRDYAGAWMDRGAATTAADARTLWARFVRDAMRDDDQGGKARTMLRSALDRLPPMPGEPVARRQRELVADLIERARAVLEDREPGVADALMRSPRTGHALVEAYFADAQAMARISPETQRVYRTQAKKFQARFGASRVDEITLPQMRAWYLDLQKQVSIATANVAIGAAGAMFQWAMWQDPQWLAVSPTLGIGRDQALGRRVFWTAQEELAFIPWCDANGYADVADAVTVCLWTGARQIDVAKASIADLSQPTWRFIPQKTQRKGQEALPGLLEPIKRRVERRMQELASSSLRHLGDAPFLWEPSKNRAHTSPSIGARYREARAAAVAAKAMEPEFAGKRLQDTRDTCVTRLAAADVSLERIASWGGWSVETAKDILREHYLSLLDESALETADKLRAWAIKHGLDLAAA